MTRLVGVVFFLVSCAVAKAAAPSGPGGVRIAEVLAPGDTLAYTVSWAAGARATSYDFTVSVSATNGTWTAVFGTTPAGALPATGNTTALTFSPKLIAIPWDSATFTVTVASRNGAGVSSPATASWTVRKKPGPPGLPKVDSALTVTGMLFVKPPTVSLLVATYGTNQPFDSATCVQRIVAVGQRWSRGTAGAGWCINQWGSPVVAPLRDSVVVSGSHRLLALDTLGHYAESMQLAADSLP